jgi:tetratricopeptide (TPR) repeat protein
LDIELPAPEQVMALLPKWQLEHPRLQAMMERYGEPSKALRHVGLLLWQQSDLQNAMRMFAGAVALAPQEASLWSGLGGVLFAGGHRQEAAGCLKNALHRDPSSTADWLLLGTIYSGEPDIAFAEEAFLNALRLDPRSADAGRARQSKRCDLYLPRADADQSRRFSRRGKRLRRSRRTPAG